MSDPPHRLDATKQSHVDAVAAAAGGSASALVELPRLLQRDLKRALTVLPSSALFFGDNGDRSAPDPSDLLGELLDTSA